MRAIGFSMIASMLGLPACDAYDHDLGPTPFLCGPTEPRCPNDYRCEVDPSNGEEVCVDNRGFDEFECADDSALEPNENLSQASPTLVDSIPMFVRDRLAICPATDRDVFAIAITADERLEIVVTRTPPDAVFEGGMVNAGGVPVATLAPVAGMAGTMRAMAQGLSSGMYFVQLSGAANNERLMNYKLTVSVTPP